MIIFPAIDITNGKVVRLKQGKFDQVIEYSDDPVTMAKKWVNMGAAWLHVVDLDGAKNGEIRNLQSITNIVNSVPASVQMGGGVRSLTDITSLINAGVKRVVLGTKVIQNRNFLRSALNRWPDQIAVSIDCSKGMVAQRGWTEVTKIRGVDLAVELEDMGLKYLIYTDISRDGMLTGPDVDGLLEIIDNTSLMSVISSGGVSSMDDIDNLLQIKSPRLLGVITGRAIYEGTLDLESALKKCSQNA